MSCSRSAASGCAGTGCTAKRDCSPVTNPAFSLTALDVALTACVPPECTRLVVAFSGGLDSTVLLHALAAFGLDDRRRAVRVVHIDHDMHPDSRECAARCREVSASLRISDECSR